MHDTSLSQFSLVFQTKSWPGTNFQLFIHCKKVIFPFLFQLLQLKNVLSNKGLASVGVVNQVYGKMQIEIIAKNDFYFFTRVLFFGWAAEALIIWWPLAMTYTLHFSSFFLSLSLSLSPSLFSSLFFLSQSFLLCLCFFFLLYSYNVLCIFLDIFFLCLESDILEHILVVHI